MSSEAKCPYAAMHGARTTAAAQSNRDWWPNQLNLGILRQHSAKSDPMGPPFDYGRNSASSTLRRSRRTSAR